MGAKAPTDTKTSFVGTLVQRQHKTGQPFVQLLFKSGDTLQLSLSKNIKCVKSLMVGETYRVIGVIKTIGTRECLVDATALPYTSPKVRALRLVAFAVIACALLTGLAAVKTRYAHLKNTAAASAATAGATTNAGVKDSATRY